MLKQLSKQKNSKVILFVLLSCLPFLKSWALSTDKDQDIEITSEYASLDEQNNTTIYYGNVILIQGSIQMTGDKLTIFHTEDNDIKFALIEGEPATYRQLPDDSEVYNEAEALQIEFYEQKSLIIMKENAKIHQENSSISGEMIVYNTELSRIKASSTTITDEQDIETATLPETGDITERVQVILKAKEDSSDSDETKSDEPNSHATIDDLSDKTETTDIKDTKAPALKQENTPVPNETEDKKMELQ